MHTTSDSMNQIPSFMKFKNVQQNQMEKNNRRGFLKQAIAENKLTIDQANEFIYD